MNPDANQIHRPNFRTLLLILVSLTILIIIEYIDEVYLTTYSWGASSLFPSPFKEWDLEIFKLINLGLSSQALDAILGLITQFGSTIFWLAVAVFLWVTGKKEDAVLLTVAIVVGGILFFPIKLIVSRARPYQVLFEIHVIDPEGGFSFPSGHTKNAFSGAVILGNKHKKWAPLLYVLSSIIGFSRIYVGAHWPTDVIVGAISGCLFGTIVLKFNAKIKEKVNAWFKLKI